MTCYLSPYFLRDDLLVSDFLVLSLFFAAVAVLLSLLLLLADELTLFVDCLDVLAVFVL